MALSGWHRGERAIHTKIGDLNNPSVMFLYTGIDGEMPPQHREFYTTRLPFIPVTVVDSSGRPWGSILAGEDGKLGFVSSPTFSTLVAKAKLWPGDPLMDIINSRTEGSDKEVLIAGIGVELSTRRRNKYAGKITKLHHIDKSSGLIHLELDVNQAIGNCPKYITLRSFYPYPNALPQIVHKVNDLTPADRLPQDVITFIKAADTAFLGTTYVADPHEKNLYPSHLGMNHRGGRPGFIRVFQSDGRTIVLPDFSGNRFMTSLGNIEATPYASLTILSYTQGHVLYLTGTAKNLLGSAAQAIMPLQDRITTIYVTGYTFVKDALPFRSFDVSKLDGSGIVEDIEPSPYSPPIRYLAEESSRAPTLLTSPSSSPSKPATALLTTVAVHSLTSGSEPGPDDIATFTFQSDPNPSNSNSLTPSVRPGQAIILSLTPLFGEKAYNHMFPARPIEVNDDHRMRTWSIVSCSQWKTGNTESTVPATIDPGSSQNSTSAFEFSVTMRLKPSGFVTTALFSLIRKLKEHKPEFLVQPGGIKELGIRVCVVGVSGGFERDESGDAGEPYGEGKGVKRATFIAGGIGITPFLGMLHAFVNSPPLRTAEDEWDLHIVLSTREPNVLIRLVERALCTPKSFAASSSDQNPSVSSTKRRLMVKLDVFSHKSEPLLASTVTNTGLVNVLLNITRHVGRITKDVFQPYKAAQKDEVEEDYWSGREVYLCGPDSFSHAVLGMLPPSIQTKVRQEAFDY
ncbi:hypothetical protein AMATHDRAFT_76159 [Amanita thiersii Skay4041]|uniref:FAD-binding FR-type domain-containing protein n=1 Tax=Amanita thiersii Skay4041 TaxID=703135 RepID=A0A2A9NP41_9AGAR|nr:hypothetical protein AMATHDRAFT_76159 [Amanita thiersii Skay4041]